MFKIVEIDFRKFRHLILQQFQTLYTFQSTMKEKHNFIENQQPFFKSSIFDQKTKEKAITSNNRRTMTDVACIYMYCILSLIVFSSFFYSFIMEKQVNIFRPKDPNGRICGQGDASQYSYIYFPAPFAQSIQKSVCVKDCPTSTTFQLECLKNQLVSSCKFDMTDHFNRSNQFILYPTQKNYFLSMCQPSSRIIFDALNQRINTYSLFQNLQKIYQSLKIILIACPLLSISLVGLYVFIITRLDDLKYLLKGFLVVFIVCLLSFSLYSFTDSAKKIFTFMPYIGIIVFVLTLFLLITLFYLRNYIQRSLNLLNMGAEYIRQNRSLIFTSLILFILWVIVFALQFVAIIFIYSMDSSDEHSPSYSPQQYKFAYFIGIENSIFVKILLVLAIVHYFWTNLILYSVGQYICMAAGTYWILNIQHNFKNSLFTLLRFHLGSVIFGSLVNTFIGKISSFLYFIMPHRNERLLCCNCSRLSQFYKNDCFKKYLGIFYDLNYVLVALKGVDLITAGRELTDTLVDYLNHVSRAYRLARIIVFVSKVLVALTTTFICYLIITLSPSMRGYFLTNIIIFLFSSFLTSFAFESYDRSFEVILITILIHPSKQFSRSSKDKVAFAKIQGKDYQGLAKKDKLYIDVENWFYQQKQKQLQDLQSD